MTTDLWLPGGVEQRQGKEIAKQQEDTLGGERCVHSLDGGDDFTCVRMCQNVHFERV